MFSQWRHWKFEVPCKFVQKTLCMLARVMEHKQNSGNTCLSNVLGDNSNWQNVNPRMSMWCTAVVLVHGRAMADLAYLTDVAMRCW